MSKKHYPIVIISDIHLGSADSHPKKVLSFLKSIDFDTLILNGDIIDGWKLKRGRNLRKGEVELLKYFLKISKKKNVIYLRGNHDDFLDHMIPIRFGDILIDDHFELQISKTNNIEKYLVIHGDVYDKVIENMKWLAYVGDVGYTFLIKINTYYNHIRLLFGKPYYSLSKKIKNKVKQAVNFISDFEITLTKIAKEKNYHGVICGHIHHPEIKTINDDDDGTKTIYLNSGDWVESLSALVYDDKQQKFKIIYYVEQ